MQRPLVKYLCLSVLSCLVLLTSCAGGGKYKIMKRADTETTIPMSAVVVGFEDERGFEEYVNRTLPMIPIIGIIPGKYFYDRHDDIFAGTTEPFPDVVSILVAERLKQAGVFATVDVATRENIPDLGEYDLIVSGRINTLRSRGGVWRWGFSILAGWIWYLGVPYLSRYWEFDIDYWVMNGYTGEKISTELNATHETGSKFFTRYYHRGKVTDLKRKSDPAVDPFIDFIWETLPDGSDQYWANLRTEGKEHIASLEREEQRMKQGTPATFTFLSPVEGSVIRTPETTITWSITSPNGLKAAGLTLNGEQVSLGIDPLSMLNEDKAPRSISARETAVELGLGENYFKAVAVDHRGNETTTEFELFRYPQALNPQGRHVLIIGESHSLVEEDVEAFKSLLSSPLRGQFEEENVQVYQEPELTAEEVLSKVREFGEKPLSGELAFVYVRAEGNWQDFTIFHEDLTLDGFVDALSGALATSEVALVLDIDWEGGDDSLGEIDTRISNLPSRWGIVVSQSTGEGADRAIFGAELLSLFANRDQKEGRLTLENLFDELLVRAEEEGYAPEVYGRFDRSITMLEFE